jgi:hypothetical protein
VLLQKGVRPTTRSRTTRGSQVRKGNLRLSHLKASSLSAQTSRLTSVAPTDISIDLIRSSKCASNNSRVIIVGSTRMRDTYGKLERENVFVVNILCGQTDNVSLSKRLDGIKRVYLTSKPTGLVGKALCYIRCDRDWGTGSKRAETHIAAAPPECPIGTIRCPAIRGDRTKATIAGAHS